MKCFSWQASIVDAAGNVQGNATIEVRDAVSNALVQLYSDVDGASPIGNPITADAEGFVLFYAAAGRYNIEASSGGFSRTWSDVRLSTAGDELYIRRTAGEIAGGVIPTDYSYPQGWPERYGAAGDGSTDDFDAVQAAIDAGGDVYLSQEYFLGTYDTANQEVTVLRAVGVSHARYYGPGKLIVESDNDCVPRILDVDDCHDMEISWYFRDIGYDSAETYQGAIAVNLVCAVGDVYNMRLHISGDSLVCGVSTGDQTAGTPDFLAYNIDYACCFTDHFYGIQFRNCGDKVTGYVKTTRAHRSYFVYGAHDHDIRVMSDDHPLGAPQDCLIKCYDGRDTRRIKVRYSCTNFQANTACVYIGNETTNGKVTRDIDVECNDVDPTNANGYSVFIASTTAGVTDSTTTKVITDLKISGHCRFIPHVATSFQNTTYRNQLLIELEGDLAQKLTSIRPVVYGWGGTAMAGVNNAFNTRWKIGDKIHIVYAGLINSARVDVPVAPNINQAVPVEMIVVDAAFSSSSHLHKQVSYFVAGATAPSVAPSVFGSAADFTSTNGSVGTITQGTADGDADSVGAIRFTFSGWQSAPAGASGYYRFVYPDSSRDEVSN